MDLSKTQIFNIIDRIDRHYPWKHETNYLREYIESLIHPVNPQAIAKPTELEGTNKARSTHHQPIEKQVEEAFPCNYPEVKFQAGLIDSHCGPIFHLLQCPASHRPAVLALLERREQEHAAEMQEKVLSEAIIYLQDPQNRKKWSGGYVNPVHAHGIFYSAGERLRELRLRPYAALSQPELERREQEHARDSIVLVEALKRIIEVRGERDKVLIVAETALAAYIPEQPELGPCGRHSKEFWVSHCAGCGQYVDADWQDAHTSRGPDGEPAGCGPVIQECTTCAQEKAAPGGVSQESQ